MERLYGMNLEMILHVMFYVIGGLIGLVAGYTTFGLHHLPCQAIGILEKLCSNVGPGAEGRLMVLDKESSFRASVLRGGFCLLYWIWQFRLHRGLLKSIRRRTIGCLFVQQGKVRSEDTRSTLACSNNAKRRQCGYQPRSCGRDTSPLVVRSYKRAGMSPNARGAANNRWCPNACSPPV